MEKAARKDGEIHNTPTVKQNTAICSGRTDWKDYREGFFQFFFFFVPPPLHLICHEVKGWSDHSNENRKGQNTP